MCIVCDIKALKPSAEVMAKVEELARGLDTALTVAGEVAAKHPDAFNEEQRDRMQSAADLLNVRDGGLGGLGALLAAILGGRVNVETVVVVPNEGESIDEAIKRTLADNEASTKAFTKH